MGSIVAGTLLLTATGLFSQAVGFLYRIALSRLIGAEAMGLYQLVMPVYSVLMSLTAVGLTVAVSTLTARYHALGDTGAVRLTLRRALGCFLLVAIPLGAVVVLASDPISVYLMGDARTRLGIALLAPCVLLTGVENLHKHCFYGMGRVGPPAASETVEQLIRAGAVIALLVLLPARSEEGTVGLIVLGMVLCEVCSATVLALLLWRYWQRNPPAPAQGQVRYRRLATTAIPVGLTSLLGTLLGSANAVLIPARLVAGGAQASQAMAQFGVVCGMTLPMLALPTGFVGALGLVMVPDLARRTAQGNRQAAARFLDRAVSATSLLMAPALALLTVVGPTLGELLFREERAGAFLIPLAVGTLLGCYQGVLSGALNGLGLQGRGARNAILSDVAQLACTWVLVPQWGLEGFVLGFVLSALVGAGLNLVCVLRAAKLRARPGAWFARPLLAALFMGAWCQLFFRILLRAGCPEGWACALCVLMGLVLYSAALLAQGLSPGDLLTRRGRAGREGDGRCGS
ncbi:MAG TPA: oligosaccharide flippase family protein [Firmicutes bacterium]|nr:oligosaccharide flippase family protein [Bacillota bacterium]